MIDEKKLFEEMQTKKDELKAERPFNDKFCRGFAFAMEFVKIQPKVMEWIPVSERLPDEDVRVLVSTKTEIVTSGLYTTRYGFERREGFICGDGFMWMNTANAWMPLPSPWKGEEDV